MNSKSLCAAIAASFILVGTASSMAAPAAAAINVNVRSGPGPNFEALDILMRGEVVDVLGCELTDWCLVNYGSWNGWVAGGYLDFRREARAEPRPSQPWGQEYPVRYDNEVEIRQYYNLPPHVNQQVGGMYRMQPVYSDMPSNDWSQQAQPAAPVSAPSRQGNYSGGSSAW